MKFILRGSQHYYDLRNSFSDIEKEFDIKIVASTKSVYSKETYLFSFKDKKDLMESVLHMTGSF